MSHTVTITGAPPFNDPSNPGAGPQPQPRRNIKDLVKDEKQFSLYIQALRQLQSQQNTSRTLNWFAISGIHGEPSSETWDNGGDKPVDGYCAHGVPTFPTWHRPYVALFEQTLQATALSIAQKYPATERDAWVTAAQRLRAPFWDWADPDTYLPPKEVYDLVNHSTLNIKPAPGTTSPVKNPLTSYVFQTKIDWSEVGLNLPSDKTVRYPRSTPQASVTAFESGVTNAFTRPGMAFELWKSLNWLDTWDAMSNGRVTQGGRANSLESLHGTVHVVTGRGGHMAEIAASGFDPLFWLHHTNVDRQLALWQALHPGQWLTGPDLNADLHPFWKGANNFHKSSSDTVTDQTKMGAIYPEFIGLEGLSPEERRVAIEKKVDALYDRQHTGVRKPRSGSRVAPQAAPAQAQFSALTSSVTTAAQNVAEAVTSAVAPSSAPSSVHEPLDWFIRIRCLKYQFKRSFEILFFLGPVPEDPEQWKTSESLIGVHGEFVNSRPDQCANCTRNADVTVEGFIDLTHTLERAGYGERPDEEAVENYLKENLSWRVQLTTGEVIDPKDVKRLEVSVMTIKLAEPEVGELFRPIEGIRPVHRNITSHLPGGRVGHRDYEI